MSDLNESTSTSDDDTFLPGFLEFCGMVRKNDPSILPAPGHFLCIRHLSEKEDVELADALLENDGVEYLELGTAKYTKASAEAMAKYVRTSRCLERIVYNGEFYQLLPQHEEMLCCLLPATQVSTSLKKLKLKLPPTGGQSYIAFAEMLMYTKTLRSLTLISPVGVSLPREEIFVDATATPFWRKLSALETRRYRSSQKLTLEGNCITSTGVGALLEAMEHSSHITNLDLQNNPIWNEGASLLARSLGDNALPNLTCLSLSLIAVSAMMAL
jgi:hypothetical protein